MKLTILLGYAKTDPHGNPVGPAKIISAPPIDDADARDQARLFTDAKQLHQFPKGIRALAFGEIEIRDRAAFISDAITDQIQGRQQQRLADLEAQEKKRAAEKEKAEAAANAKKRISTAAVAHNIASANLQTAKNRALDAEANWKTCGKTEALKAILDAAKDKVLELTALEAAAKEELLAAKEGRVAAPPATGKTKPTE